MTFEELQRQTRQYRSADPLYGLSQKLGFSQTAPANFNHDLESALAASKDHNWFHLAPLYSNGYIATWNHLVNQITKHRPTDAKTGSTRFRLLSRHLASLRVPAKEVGGPWSQAMRRETELSNYILASLMVVSSWDRLLRENHTGGAVWLSLSRKTRGVCKNGQDIRSRFLDALSRFPGNIREMNDLYVESRTLMGEMSQELSTK